MKSINSFNAYIDHIKQEMIIEFAQYLHENGLIDFDLQKLPYTGGIKIKLSATVEESNSCFLKRKIEEAIGFNSEFIKKIRREDEKIF